MLVFDILQKNIAFNCYYDKTPTNEWDDNEK